MILSARAIDRPLAILEIEEYADTNLDELFQGVRGFEGAFVSRRNPADSQSSATDCVVDIDGDGHSRAVPPSDQRLADVRQLPATAINQ
jgi:hypothetical protein